MKKFLILTCTILFAGAVFAFEPDMRLVTDTVKAKESGKPGFYEILKSIFGGKEEPVNKNLIVLDPDKVDIIHLRELFDDMTKDNAYFQSQCQIAKEQKIKDICITGTKPLQDFIKEMDTNAYNKQFDTELFIRYSRFSNNYQTMTLAIYQDYYNNLTIKAEYFKKNLDSIKLMIKYSNDRLSQIAEMVGMDKTALTVANK
ncbi:MAG: hypothetical protein FWF35_01070 [Elusimicrobia bacterium]|nr:hypothetical protein [Elusimicrobiota bacterium]